MTSKEYYEKLAERKKLVDWNNLKSIKAYNDYARRLRSQMEFAKK